MNLAEPQSPKYATQEKTVITIDGLAASGKSSIAKALAKELGWPYVSSGLLYRAYTLFILENAIDPQNEAMILTALQNAKIQLIPNKTGNTAMVLGLDRTKDCHTAVIDAAVSAVALHAGVRLKVNAAIGLLPRPFVAEGRDMGSVVFKDASLKIFLTASTKARALRRLGERNQSLEAIEFGLKQRDALDSVNSLPAKDAIRIDTSDLNFEEVLAHILELVKLNLKTKSL